MDERTPKNPALAANMKRLMAGRSIATLRKDMAERGLKIGGGTIHRAVKGEIGNRLESLDKIAEFFNVTIDQLLQPPGLDDRYWPFSEALQQKVLILPDEELPYLENVMRAHLRMSPIPITNNVGESHLQHTSNTYVTGTEEYADPLVRERPAHRRYDAFDESRQGLGTEDEAASDRGAHRPKDRGGH